MLRTNLPVIDPQEIRALNRNQELQHTLIDLRRDVETAARRIELGTLLALARSRSSGENDPGAVEKLVIEVRAVLNELAQHGEAVRTLVKVERERQAPLVAEAGRQDIELQRKIEEIDRGLHLFGSEVETQREALRKAGIKPAEIERLIAQDAESREARRIGLVAERDALLTEQKALGQFLRTRDEQCLLEGFTVHEPIKVGGRCDE
jgi:hypothetical protein